METTRFFSPVKKVLTSEIAPGLTTNSYNQYSIVVETETEKRIVSMCSEDYCLIPNNQIFPSFEKELSGHFEIKPKYLEKNLSQFYVDYQLVNTEHLNLHSDECIPMIRVHHSYNKASSFSVSFGYYRKVCSNGLWLFRSEGESTFKHFVGNEKVIYNQIIKSAYHFVDKAKENKKMFEKLWDHQVVNVEQRIEEVIKKTGYLKRVQQEIVARALIEQAQLSTLNDWIIYNAFNFQLNHNTNINSPEERKMQIDREVFEFLMK